MDVKNTQNTEPRVVELRDLLDQLLRRWYLLVIIIAICLIFTTFYTKFICTPTYDSTAKIYVGRTTSDQVSTSDISVSTYLAKDYAELIADRTVLCAVIEQLDLNYSYDGLYNRVAINNPQNTRIISVTVRTNDPLQSMQIAQSICEIAREKIMELFNVDFVNIISEAYKPTSPSGPNLSQNLTYALITGFILSALLIIILSFADDKINNSEDVVRYLGVSILGTIPYARGREKPPYRRSSQNKKSNTAIRSKANNG